MSHLSFVSIWCSVLLASAASVFAAPNVQTMTPEPGATVSTLTQVSVTFSEPVANVDAADLVMNDETASTVSGSGAGPYVFTFTQPLPGLVNVSWDLDHGIAGFGSGAFAAPAPWTYTLTDTIAPTVALLTPAAGSTVGSLSRIEVMFSEAVTGLDAADLLVNGSAATALSGSGVGPYIFTFPEPPLGSVEFAWTPAHGIRDTASPANAFAGGIWTVTRSAGGAGTVVINEFLAANGTGLADENASQEDWIELHNAGSTPVNLIGWALTDDPDDLAKWIFPSRSLAPGGYLVVFASRKNRTAATGNLHTNFTLNENGGYLALVSPESPRVAVSAFTYPEQRTDHSFGPQSGGGLRYFRPATPNATNGTGSLTAITPQVSFNVTRGFFKDPFQLVLTCADSAATIRYTTDFTEPTATTGTVFSGPISVGATTIIRAVAFNAAKIPSLPVTHSYVFLDAVLTQPNNPAGFPANWGPHSGFPGGVVPADYEVDLDPLRTNPNDAASPIDPAKEQRLKDGLRELPIVSVTIPMIDMFGTSGIYHSANVQNKNFGYKKCSVEMILPDGSTAFSIICGISGHGNASRDPLKNPKHGFQLKFKGDFGESSLNYKLFPDSPAEDYDDLILRPDFNSSWRHWSDSAGNGNGAFQRTRATRLRDAFAKNTFRDMGDLASHHRFFHLFINGLYWGTYDFAEQPVDGFAKSYLGGEKADYAIIHEGVARNGADPVYSSMLAMPSISTNALYEQMKGYLDVPEFIDYMMLHFFIGHQDWGNVKNWYAIRRRASTANPVQGKYQYIPWDDECTLLEPSVNRVSNSDVPSGLHTKLVPNAQYKLDFADRVHRHMIAPGGALTSPENIARWQKWQAVMDKPIVGESVRWGDYRRDVHRYQDGAFVLYTRETHWLAENNRLTTNYFPGRTTTVLNQLRTAGLYPSVAAPEFRENTTTGSIVASRHVSAGSVIAIHDVSGAGTIYYTTDGNDPHIYYTPTTGATASTVASSAQVYAAPLPINGTVTIKSRILSGGTWSALNEATFTVGSPAVQIAITEIMFDPPGGAAHEFIELQNYGNQAVDLSGYYFEGIEFLFPIGTVLGPGGRLVLASNNDPTGFTAQYPGVTAAGYFGGSLDNSGERIALYDPSGRTVVSVRYGDRLPWPVAATGGGYSIELTHVNGDPDSPFNWRSSAGLKGSPGNANAPINPTVVLSEVMAHNVSAVSNGDRFSDYVELHNRSAAPVSLAGWVLVSSNNFVFPVGTSIPADGYLVVWLDNATTAPGLHSSSDTGLDYTRGDVYLQNASGVVDGIRFGNQVANHSIGRVAGEWRLTQASPGAANAAAAMAPAAANLALNEWFAKSSEGSSDWIELYNKHGTLPVALSGLFFQTSSQLYRFDALSFVAPAGYVQLFADEQPGSNQLDLKIPAEGTTFSILDSNGAPIESVTFGIQTAGVSQGRLPDGAATISDFAHGGSPGAANHLVTYAGPLLNEVLARNIAGATAPWGARADWVELYNAAASDFNLSGMRLGASRDFNQAWTFPNGSTVPPGGYLAVWCDVNQPPSSVAGADMNTAQSLGDDRGALYLFNTAGDVVDVVAWGFQIADLSIGRVGAEWRLLASATRAATNAAPATLGPVASLRINEWFDGGAGPDWLELYNSDAAPVDLGALFITDDPSERGVTKYQIAPLNFIAARGWARLWGEGVVPVGNQQTNFSLDNSGESLRLSAADLSLIDSISFGAQTVGISEGRLPDGQAVRGSLGPTPGAANEIAGAPAIVQHPISKSITQGATVVFELEATGAAPLTYQWRFNGSALPGQTGRSLTLTGASIAAEGSYSCTVTNVLGSVASNPAGLVIEPTSFAQWVANYFSSAEQADLAVSGPAADPDKDGVSNLQELLHNLHPRSPIEAAARLVMPQLGTEPPTGNPQFLTLTYRRNGRATLPPVEYEVASDLTSGAWSSITPDATEQLGVDPVTGDPLIRVKFAVPPGQPNRFLRLLLRP